MDELSAVVLDLLETEGGPDAAVVEGKGTLLINVGGIDVGIDYLPGGRTAVISADIGIPDEMHAGQIHTFLLTASRPWTTTGGVAFARGVDGTLSAFYVLPLADLTAERLGAVVANLAAKAMVLKAAIQAGAAETERMQPTIDDGSTVFRA